MRRFVYLNKNNRAWFAPAEIAHRQHPRFPHKLRIETPQRAWHYTAEVLVDGKLWGMAIEYIERKITHPVLVPIPASCTTSSNIEGRWSALGIAREVAARGLGRVLIPAVLKTATGETKGKSVPASVLRANLTWYEEPKLKPWETIVYVDDVLNRGAHIVSVDAFLGHPKLAAAITVGCTETVQRKTAMRARINELSYSTNSLDYVVMRDVATEQS